MIPIRRGKTATFDNRKDQEIVRKQPAAQIDRQSPGGIFVHGLSCSIIGKCGFTVIANVGDQDRDLASGRA